MLKATEKPKLKISRHLNKYLIYLEKDIQHPLVNKTLEEIVQAVNHFEELVDASQEFYEVNMNPKKFKDEEYEERKYALEQILNKVKGG